MDIKLPAYLKIVVVLLGVFLIVVIMREAKLVLVPLLIAGLFAILVSPLTSWMEKKGVPAGLAVVASLIALIAFLLGFIYFFYNQILGFSGDLVALEKRVSELVDSINIFIANNIEGSVPISMDNIRETIFMQLYQNFDTLTKGIIATAGTVTMVLIMPIYIFLFLYYRKFLAEFVKRAFSERHKEKVTKVLDNVKMVVQNYIVGMFFVILILAVLNSIALFSLGVKHALLFAVFAALLNVIPFLGPFLGAVFPILYTLLTKDSLWYPFGVFLAFYFIQLAESNFFTPKIVGGKVSMNPLMTIIALFVGNFIWGLAGMVLFIPGMAVLKVIFDEIEGMEPYGFLLGTVKDGYNKTRNTRPEPVLLAEIKKRLKF
jgi:predicted PurR-regulated permease PerM